MTEQPALTFLYEAIGQLNGRRRTETMTEETCKLYPHDFINYSTPTLIMGGRHDHFLTPDHHLHIGSLIPGARTHTFENSGHSAYWEEPAEYNRVVATFLKENV
jgi:pimeloyl-ACP methyl ester carboxylesterase